VYFIYALIHSWLATTRIPVDCGVRIEGGKRVIIIMVKGEGVKWGYLVSNKLDIFCMIAVQYQE
jgi:hypothetical protein